ncbi:MAG: tRNA (adenosine(37)-N6)-dimethylallyltransferase MiaA [Bacillota bacterium]
MSKPDLLVITGPTASGKTGLSLKLAQLLEGEIISADSMQIYRHMDIGTDKVDQETRKKIPHHLLDICSPEEDFSAAEFKRLAETKIQEILARDKLPILVGGTTMYIKAVVEGFMLPQLPHNEYRKKYKEELSRIDKNRLHTYLTSIDPDYAARIHPNDSRRVIRALEIYHLTGKTRTYYEYRQKKQSSRFNYLQIALKQDRQKLYDKINQRVEEMVEQGLFAEVKYVTNTFAMSRTAKQALGYKEVIDYYNGKYDKATAIAKIKQGSRHLAKRQLTYLRRNDKNIWINPDHWFKPDLSIYLSDLARNKFDILKGGQKQWKSNLLKCTV